MLRGEPASPQPRPRVTEAERVFIAPVVGWLVVSSTVPLLVGGLLYNTYSLAVSSTVLLLVGGLLYNIYSLVVSRHDRPTCGALAAVAKGATPQFFWNCGGI